VRVAFVATALMMIPSLCMAQTDKFEEARLCVGLSQYADEIQSIVLQSASGEIFDHSRLIDVAAMKAQSSVRLYDIVASPKSHAFVFDDSNGIYRMEKLARACIAQKSCDNDVAMAISGFSHFLLETCRSDFQGQG
jgi:hypothetical protein